MDELRVDHRVRAGASSELAEEGRDLVVRASEGSCHLADGHLCWVGEPKGLSLGEVGDVVHDVVHVPDTCAGRVHGRWWVLLVVHLGHTREPVGVRQGVLVEHLHASTFFRLEA